MLKRPGSALAAAALLVAAVIPASAGRVGSEFLVSPTGFQQSVAQLKNGGFIVVWRPDGGVYGIRAQRYDAKGKKTGGKFVVLKKSGEQVKPSVAGLTNGNFLVAWNGQDSSGAGVFAQRFNSKGEKLGGTFRVNSYVTNDQHEPSVASLAGGGFVIAWTSIAQAGSTSAVYIQRYTNGGNKVGGEVRADSTLPAGFHDSPSAAGLKGGGFAVVWRAYLGVNGQAFAANGAKVGTEFRVNPLNFTGQFVPEVAGLENGGFVVVRESVGEDGSDTGVYGQRYSQSGGAVGGGFRVNSTTGGVQSQPNVAGLGGGGFVVVWDAAADVVHGQRYKPNGAKTGGEFKVNTTSVPSSTFPVVVPNGENGFVAVWWAALGGIRGQRYD